MNKQNQQYVKRIFANNEDPGEALRLLWVRGKWDRERNLLTLDEWKEFCKEIAIEYSVKKTELEERKKMEDIF